MLRTAIVAVLFACPMLVSARGAAGQEAAWAPPSRESPVVFRDGYGAPHVFGPTDEPLGSVGRRYGVHGNTFVKVIEFGPRVRGRSVLVFGQSGDPASPHYVDQAPLYAERRFKPAWMTREEVEAHAEGQCELRR